MIFVSSLSYLVKWAGSLDGTNTCTKCVQQRNLSCDLKSLCIFHHVHCGRSDAHFRHVLCRANTFMCLLCVKRDTFSRLYKNLVKLKQNKRNQKKTYDAANWLTSSNEFSIAFRSKIRCSDATCLIWNALHRCPRLKVQNTRLSPAKRFIALSQYSISHWWLSMVLGIFISKKNNIKNIQNNRMCSEAFFHADRCVKYLLNLLNNTKKRTAQTSFKESFHFPVGLILLLRSFRIWCSFVVVCLCFANEIWLWICGISLAPCCSRREHESCLFLDALKPTPARRTKRETKC